MSAGIRAVLWDADGVLQRVPGGGQESIRSAVEGLVDDVEGFLADAVTSERPALRGEESWPAVLPGLLERWRIPDAYDELLRGWLTIEPLPQSRHLLRRVRAGGTACHLATNQAAERGRLMHEQLGYADLVDQAFYSYRLGVAKPDPAYFTRIATELDLTPGQLLFFDDVDANVDAARAAGLHAEQWDHHQDITVLHDHLTRHGVPLAPASAGRGSS